MQQVVNRICYSRRKKFRLLSGRAFDTQLVHRIDYHSDGSQTDTYYLGLDREQFERLGGETCRSRTESK